MKAKKIISLLMVGMMGTMAITGCGGSENKQEGQESTDKESSTEEKENEDVVLSVFDFQAYGLEEYAEVVKAFEKDHPGVTVEVQHAANDGTTLLQSRVNSGDVPDVFAVEAGTAASMYYDYAYDWTDDTETTKLFREDALEMGMDEEDKIKALPWSYANMGLIYNKECFEKAGIDKLPVTMDELEDVCEKLDAVGITPIALGSKETWVLGQVATHFMLDKNLGADGTNEALKNGELKFEDLPHWDNLFRFLDLAIKYGPDKPLEMDWEQSENMLANGEAAMIHMGDWCQSTLDSFNPDAQLAFLPAPVGDTEEDTTLLTCCNWVWIVNKDSENVELAKEFLLYTLTSDLGLSWTCEGVGAVSAAISDVKAQGMLANNAETYISEGKTDGWMHHIAPKGYAETCGAYLQAYLTGDMTQEEVTQLFQEFYTAG